jgi:hypothetical protein
MEDEIELLLPTGARLELAQSQSDRDKSIQEPSPMPDEIVLEAKRQITLRCGKSSITLYANGKIALRGDYILSDADGINRIAGGQVELN